MKSVAIVGASADRTKYGNKGVRAYKDEGWEVYPVNPKGGEIEGLKTYESIGDVPDGVDRVSMYLPPAKSKELLDEIAAKNPGEVFFNPGSEDAAVMEAAKEKGLNAIDKCSIVAIGRSPSEFPED